MAQADGAALAFSPEHTQIQFTLPATFHEVHGTLKLQRGELHFDEGSGSASGTLVIDARSAETGNSRRDANMHSDVLESEKYPEIAFTAERVELKRQDADRSDAVLHGRVKIHGGVRPLDIPAQVERRTDDSVRVRASFAVPYVKWGIQDPSNYVLHVAPEVQVTVDATARYTADGAAPADASESAP